MTRYLYGAGGDAEINSQSTGLPMASTTANVYNARTGGAAVTDLQNLSGGAISQPVSDAYGQFAFYGPDGFTSALWLDLGVGPRWAMRPVDLGVITTSLATTTAASTISATRSSDYTNRVFTPKAALPKNSNDPLEAALADALDPLVIPRFASSSARNTAFPSPADGDMCYRTDNHQFESYNSAVAGWLPLNQGVWTNYTVSWTAASVNPTLGNGTILARYTQIGKTIHYSGVINCGSTTNGGTGTWSVSLPATAVTLTNGEQSGTCKYNLVGTGDFIGITRITSGATTMQFHVKTGTNSSSYDLVSNTVPGATASGNRLWWNVAYEMA